MGSAAAPYRQIGLFTHALSPEQFAQLDRVVRQFHRVQHVIRLSPGGPRELEVHAGRVDFRALRRLPSPGTSEIVVTGLSLADNWFTHAAVDRALINVSEWEMAFSADPDLPPYAPDAYILASLALVVFLLCCRGNDVDFCHRTTKGCLCDLCQHKPDRIIKMRSGYLCATCKDRAAQAGVSPLEIDAIQAVIDQVRLLTLGRSPQTEGRSDPDGDDEFLRTASLPPEVELPEPLVAACAERRLTLFIGSGLSLQSDVQVEYRDSLPWKACRSGRRSRCGWRICSSTIEDARTLRGIHRLWMSS